MVTSEFMGIFKRVSKAILFLFGSLQVCFNFSADNFFCVFLVLVAWLITDAYLLKKEKFQQFALSSLTILGFSMTQFLLPLVFTFLELKPITYNLLHSVDIFVHSLLALIVLIVMHFFYTKKIIKKQFKTKVFLQNILVNLNLFTIPTERQLWIMGIIGQIATVADALFSGPVTSDASSSVVSKFLQGFVVFSTAPYFLFFRKIYGETENKKINNIVIKFSVFLIVQIIIGIILNARAVFMSHITTLGVCYFIALLMGKYDIKKISAPKALVTLLLIVIIVRPLTDLSVAMVNVRSQRSNISASELVNETLSAYNDKKAIEETRKLMKSLSTETSYSEAYLNSVFLSRFCNLKFNDNSLDSYYRIGKADELMQRYTFDRILAIFPTPILNFFGIKLDKEFLTRTSFGDYVYFRAGGDNALGGLRTGQFAGVGMATFGWLYLFILAISLFPFYYLFDSLLLLGYKDKHRIVYLSESCFSLAGLIAITYTFLFFASSTSSESVTNILAFLIRGWIQLVFLYYLIFSTSKLF